MASKLTPELFKQIVDALLPEMNDPSARQALIGSALFGSLVLQKIQWAGAARPFTINLVKVLDDFGDLDTGQSALTAVLLEVRGQVGSNRQAQIDATLAPFSPMPGSANPPAPDLVQSKDYVAPTTPSAPAALAVSNPPPVISTNAPTNAPSSLSPVIQTVETQKSQLLSPNVLVMKGGGVKGIAYVGALEVLENYGYRFDHFVGTSAGAISAALLAVGYSTPELRDVLAQTDFRKFKDGWLPLAVPLLVITKGLYRGDEFARWLENKLRAKFPSTFGAVPILFRHLKNAGEPSRRLTIFASTRHKTAYRFDSEDPKDQDTKISFACRCSMAIPYFFRPEQINGEMVFDGGMQNNYPVKALLERESALGASRNFIGLYLGAKEEPPKNKWAWHALYSIATEASDEEAKNEFIDQTIVIDPQPVRTTDFSLSPNDVQFLLAEGRASALQWLYYHTEGKRPTVEEVEQAQQEAQKLRAITTAERTMQQRNTRRKRLLFIILFVGLLSGVYWYFQR